MQSDNTGIALYFECVDLAKTVVKLKAKGIKFDQDPVDQTWLWQEAHFNNLDGNTLILYRAGKNRKNPPWRVE